MNTPRSFASHTIERSSRASGVSAVRTPSPHVFAPIFPWKCRATLTHCPSRFFSIATSIASPAG